jgi:hypothetical protein
VGDAGRFVLLALLRLLALADTGATIGVVAAALLADIDTAEFVLLELLLVLVFFSELTGPGNVSALNPSTPARVFREVCL